MSHTHTLNGKTAAHDFQPPTPPPHSLLPPASIKTLLAPSSVERWISLRESATARLICIRIRYPSKSARSGEIGSVLIGIRCRFTFLHGLGCANAVLLPQGTQRHPIASSSSSWPKETLDYKPVPRSAALVLVCVGCSDMKPSRNNFMCELNAM